jgi:hypothetical protein
MGTRSSLTLNSLFPAARSSRSSISVCKKSARRAGLGVTQPRQRCRHSRDSHAATKNTVGDFEIFDGSTLSLNLLILVEEASSQKAL